MSRRGVPRIAPADLRDHATDERVARVWERIESDLGGLEQAPPRRSSLAVALLAASFAAFSGGLFAGKALWGEPGPAPPAAVASQDLPAVVDVFAAGTQERAFALPGGGEILLGPGTTIEVEQADGGALTLRLVQGEASVDTAGGARTAALAIVAGEARLGAAAGSVLHVRHNVDDIDVNVTDGSVQLTSPAGAQALGRGDHAAGVPIRQRTSSLAPTSPARVRAAPVTRSIIEEPAVEPAPVAAAPAADWRSRYNAGDVPDALQSLKQQPGGVGGAITSARTAKELMDLSDLLRAKGGDAAAAIRALTRVVDSFPDDANAQIAAYTLGNMYERVGDQAKAAMYFERARTLSPEGNLAEDSFCKRIRAEVIAGHKEEASRMATEYVAKYPDGRCKEEVQRIISGEDASPDEEQPDPAPPPDASAAP